MFSDLKVFFAIEEDFNKKFLFNFIFLGQVFLFDVLDLSFI